MMDLANTDNAARQNRARQLASEASALYAAGRFGEAAAQFRLASKLWAEQPDFHYNQALSAWAAGDLATTRSELLATLAIRPDYAAAQDALARLLINSDEAVGAAFSAAEAIRLEPQNPEFNLTYANVCQMQGDFETGWQRLQAIILEPRIAERAAHLLLRISKPLRREFEAIATAKSILARPATNAVDRRRLHFALAAALDGTGKFADAFGEAVAAHAIQRPRYDSYARRHEFELRMKYWSKDRLAQLPRASLGPRVPIFIVGMPRSGTSLVEQILSRHPDIYAAGELSAIPHVAAELDRSGKPYPLSLATANQADVDGLARRYLDEVAALDSNHRAFTDKLPLNFMYLELIDRLFPNAKVIHCVRDRRDTCLSCFMTDFATPYDFASSIEDLGAFHALYEQIMRHWKQVLTVRILDVPYESVVEDLESETRRILEFAELPWDERCRNFHESDRRVITASKDQVKRPLYQSSVGRWKNYASQLAALQR